MRYIEIFNFTFDGVEMSGILDIKKERIKLYFKTVYEAELRYLLEKCHHHEKALSDIQGQRDLVKRRMDGIAHNIGRATEADLEAILFLIGDPNLTKQQQPEGGANAKTCI